MELFSDRLNFLLFGGKVGDVSSAIGVSFSTVYYWKRGEKEISLSNLIALADYFEVEIDYLVGRSENDVKVLGRKCPPFGARLREVMKEKGVSTYFLRKYHGFGSDHFKKWDNGADPMLSTLVELCELLDCSMDYLVGRI